MSEPALQEGASTNASASKSEEELKRPKMKKGDYSVHVFVEDGRGFLPDKEFDTVDPLVNVIVFNKSKTTRALDDVGSSATVHWGEHLFFEKANAGLNDLEGEVIAIEVRDHRTLRPDTLLGRYEFDVPLIYNRPSHAIFHQWLALCNPEAENFEVVRGYVKVSISVLHEDDKPVDLTKKVNTSEKDVLIPTQLKPKASQLIVTVLKADNLPKMDRYGTVDAYMMVRFATSSVTTSVETPKSEEIMSVFWLQDLFLPVMQPSVSSKLSITLWDRDTAARDDMVGGFNLNWDKIKTGKFVDYFWANIYGAPPLKDNDAATYMNKKSETASYWRGRVLIRLRIEENQKKNYLKAEQIENKALVEEMIQKQFETGPEFEIRAQVYNAVALPKEKSNYKITVQWADVTLESKVVPAMSRCAAWYENLKRKIVLIPNRAQFPDVFIYLSDGSNNICFARIKAEKFIREDSEPIWVELKPDKSIGVVKEDWKMAFVKIRVIIGRTKFESKVKKRPETVPNFGTIEFNTEPKVDDTEIESLWEDAGKKSWDIYPALPKVTLNKWNESPAPPKPSPKVLWCHLFQCKHLPAADSNGTSDPYVVFRCDKAKAITDKKAKAGCLNPTWYETHELQVDFQDCESAPPILVYVYDYDPIGSPDFLGMIIVDMKEVKIGGDCAPEPKWYKLHMGDKEPSGGEILLSFNLFEKGQVPELKFNIVPNSYEVEVEISVLGLRDLKPSVGWLPVNKPFLKLDLNSVNRAGEDVSELKTQPNESGANPNINTVLSFHCMMPYHYIYCPAISCTVQDYLFYGLSTPIIGTFYIDLGKLLQAQLRRGTSSAGTFSLDGIKNAGSAPPPKPAILAPEEPKQDYDVSGPTQRFKTIASPADLPATAPDRVNLLGGWGSDAVTTPAQHAPSSLNPSTSSASGDLKSAPLYQNSFGVGSGGWGADPRATQPAVPAVRGEPSSNRTTLGQSIEMTGVRSTNNSEVAGLVRSGVDYATSWGATLPTAGAVASLNAYDYEERKSLLDQTPDDHLVTPVRKTTIKPEEQSLISSSHTNRIVDVRRPDEDEVMSVKSTRLNPISVTEAKAGMTIIWPQYVKTKKGFKELNKPDESQFMEIGHNKVPDEQNMHYRYYIDTELEKSEFLNEYPFHLYPLKKGQSRGLSGPFMFGAKYDKSGQKSNEREVGRFKGRIRIIPADQVEARKEKLKKYNEKKELLVAKLNDRKEGDLKAILEATEDLGDEELAQDYEIAKALLVKTSVLVRVYILEAFNLEQKDWGSASDPYVKISLGDQVINDRKNYQLDEPNPKIYKYFEFSTHLPGVSVLKIKFYDFDDLFPDDHIGTTKIDLEDRFFSKQWNEITHKPIETRPLYIKTSRRPQGYVRLWIDMFAVPDKPDAWFIQPRPPAEFEARVIIWRCTDVESMDFGGVSDLFVRAWINNSKPKETDTHFRAANGQGSWNWRLKFNVTLPYPTNVLNLQIWDRDLFSSNDYIGDACLPFDDLAKEAWATNKRLKMYGASGDWRDRALRRDNETFKVQLKRKTTQGEKDAGFLYISFELLPKDVAESCKVGEGRDEPNVDPRLPPPIGRIEWTMNPLKMMSQLVGPEMKTKALMLLCCILCCLMLIFIAPMVFSNILADMVNPFN